MVAKDVQSISLLAIANIVHTAVTQASIALQMAQSTAENTTGVTRSHGTTADACQAVHEELSKQTQATSMRHVWLASMCFCVVFRSVWFSFCTLSGIYL